MSDAVWTTVRLKEGLLEGLGLPDLPFPVRTSRLGDLQEDGRVRFDRVLEELDRFVGEQPEAAETYRRTLVDLSHLLAMHEGAEGRAEDAIRLLRLGLRHAPGSVRLRADLALGLELTGRPDEAVASYRQALEAQGEHPFPVLQALAARACLKTGKPVEAYELFQAAEPQLGGDADFDRLLAQARAEAEAEAPSKSGGPKFCRACGAKLRTGKRFCTSCGGKTGAPR